MANKKIKMIITDMDGSIVNYPNKPFNSNWDVFPEILSDKKKKEWFALRDFYIKKNWAYEEWFNKRVDLLKGITFSKTLSSFFPIPYSKGVESFFSFVDDKYVKGIISSGVGFVAEKIKDELDFDFQVSNHLEIKNGKFTGKGKTNCGFLEKGRVVSSFARKYGFVNEEVCYIGDHFNDIPAFNLVGLAVAFNPKEKNLEKKVDCVIYDFDDLKQILREVNGQ